MITIAGPTDAAVGVLAVIVYLDENSIPSPTQQVQITAPAPKAVRPCTMTVRFH